MEKKPNRLVIIIPNNFTQIINELPQRIADELTDILEEFPEADVYNDELWKQVLMNCMEEFIDEFGIGLFGDSQDHIDYFIEGLIDTMSLSQTEMIHRKSYQLLEFGKA